MTQVLIIYLFLWVIYDKTRIENYHYMYISTWVYKNNHGFNLIAAQY